MLTSILSLWLTLAMAYRIVKYSEYPACSWCCQPYSVGGSSDAAFCSQYYSSLLRLVGATEYQYQWILKLMLISLLSLWLTVAMAGWSSVWFTSVCHCQNSVDNTCCGGHLIDKLAKQFITLTIHITITEQCARSSCRKGPSTLADTGHRLPAGASRVLTATGLVNGRGQFLTPHRIHTP